MTHKRISDKKPICLCADDYALTPSVSKGIRELIEAGRLSAVSVMTNTDFWPEESQRLLQLQTDIDVGLHITLTNLKPIGSMPKFAPSGSMPSIKHLVKLAYFRCLPYHEIQMEIERQLQRFYLYFGRWPSHLDGHHHVHILPIIRNIVNSLFYKVLDSQQCYVRSCVDSISAILHRGVACSKALAISALSLVHKLDLQKHAISTNDSFAGIYSFQPHISYGVYFKRFLLDSNDKTIIMCHPGYVDEELKKLDIVIEQREVELRFFQSKEFKELLLGNNFELLPLASRLF